MSDARRRPTHLLLLFLLIAMGGPACDTASISPPGSNSGGTTGGNIAGQGGNPTTTTTSSPSATVLEQLSLERLNRARLRPGQEAANNGIALDEGIPGQLVDGPRQPVTLNNLLSAAARQHSQDMLSRNYFAHNTPEGITPFARMTNAGYLFNSAGENLAWRGTTGTLNEISTVEAQHTDLFVDDDIPDRGHRVTMLNGAFREVGIGIVRGFYTNNGIRYDSIMQTQDFGTPPNPPTFVLGVVYNDTNNNGRYDAGEGVASAAVSLGDVTRTANAGGGYSFAVTQSGQYTLQFSGNRSQTLNISRGQPNIKVDLVNGTTIVINLGVGILGN